MYIQERKVFTWWKKVFPNTWLIKLRVCDSYYAFVIMLFCEFAELLTYFKMEWGIGGITTTDIFKSIISIIFKCLSFFQLMETSGTDMLSDSDNRATISPLHLAVSTAFIANFNGCFTMDLWYIHVLISVVIIMELKLKELF